MRNLENGIHGKRGDNRALVPEPTTMSSLPFGDFSRISLSHFHENKTKTLFPPRFHGSLSDASFNNPRDQCFIPFPKRSSSRFDESKTCEEEEPIVNQLMISLKTKPAKPKISESSVHKNVV
jgi:hypothetical protein